MRTRQAGSTLLVVMVMLIILTLLGIAGIRMSSSSLLVVGNMQARRYVENYGLQTIEMAMNSIVPFNSASGQLTFTPPTGLTVAVGDRVCLFSAAASGYSAVSAIAPEDNQWEFFVKVSDSFTGARSSMLQGVKIRQLSGTCEATTTTASHCWKTTGASSTRYELTTCPE